MKLKTTKSVIELLKQFNHYATVKTEPELNDHEAKRNYKIINRRDNHCFYDFSDWEFGIFSIFDEDTLKKFVTEVKLYNILKNEFGDEVYYQNLYFLVYEPKNTNLSITIGYPDNDIYLNQVSFVIRYRYPYMELAKFEVLPIKDITDIVSLLKQLKDKYNK